MRKKCIRKKLKLKLIRDISTSIQKLVMAKYDGLLGQPLLEVEEPDKEGGVTLIFKDNRFMFIKVEDGKLSTISIPE
jgi:hypothetical protein